MRVPSQMLKRIVKLILSLLVFIVDKLTRRVQWFLGSRPLGSCVILVYHGIADSERALFASQLDTILKAGEPVSALASRMLVDGRKYLAITFDDALRSFRVNAWPEIQKRGLPVAVFVPTGFVGREVGWAMGRDTSALGDQVLSLSELKAMAESPLVRFGSHTVNHPELPLLNNENALRELAESKSFIEQTLGCVVDSICFPYGAYGDRDLELAVRTGYTTFFSIRPVPLRGEVGPGLLGRVQVDPTDWPLEFKLKLSGAYRWEPCLQWLRARMHLRSNNLRPRAAVRTE